MIERQKRMTSVGWIDFSSEHREKVRTVIDLLKKQGVVDEGEEVGAEARVSRKMSS